MNLVLQWSDNVLKHTIGVEAPSEIEPACGEQVEVPGKHKTGASALSSTHKFPMNKVIDKSQFSKLAKHLAV